MAITQFPDHFAEIDPDRPAHIFEPTGVVVTYGELVSRSRRIARILRERGCEQGTSVSILMENRPEFLDCTWAAQRSGLRYTAISTRLTPPEVGYILADSGARAVITSAASAGLVRAALEHAPGVTLRLCVDGDAEGFESLADIEASDEPLADEAEGIDMLYSSGTTGRPKGVEAELSLAPLGTPPGVVGLMQQRWDIGDGSVYLSPAPLYHSAPMRFSMAMHRVGATVVVMERFDALRTLELIERHGVTHTQMVPTMMIRLLKLPEAERLAYDTSTLRILIHAAAPCPPDVKRALIDWLGPVVHEFYAATENNLLTVIGPQEALERPGSVGRSILGTIHILDDDGNELPSGEVGTIWSEGGHEFVYHNDPEKTASARNDRGWSTVGDIGYLDDEGYLFLSDRRADLILSGGVNIYPREAEDALATHPKVHDAAVFGVPHDELGEIAIAVVQPEAGAEGGPELEAELLAYLGERLARYKLPRRIDFRAELPRQPTGKLYKRLLRDEYAAAAAKAAG